jgi:hypothetical protein
MQSKWGRRNFLKLIGLAAGGTALGLSAWSCADSRSEPEALAGPLTEQELDRIAAIASELFDPEDAREKTELETAIRWWAKGRTSAGPHLQVYRDGLAAAAAPAAAGALRAEVIEGIYSTGPGWRSLGYTTWPGVPSARLEYTTRPHAAPTTAGIFPPESYG